MTTIAIIGGGISGTLTAIQLLSGKEDIAVKLINTKQPLVLGVAYSTSDPEHLLNVPAGKMSAFASRPGQFTEWLVKNGYGTELTGTAFVPRMLYAKYLLEIYESYSKDPRLEVINGKAEDISKNENGYWISLAGGRTIAADKIVLAFGNFLPASPKSGTPAFYESPRYFQDPWGSEYLRGLNLNQDILLIGTGLTMVDCVLSLKKTGLQGKIIAVSPRGYIPASHGKTGSYPDFYSELKGHALSEIFSSVRKHIAIAAAKGISWRSVIDSLRPHVQEIWTALSGKEKQQFISHIRHIWGAARHRLPEETYREFIEMKEKGKLEVIGGRFLSMEEEEDSVLVNIQLRKSHSARTLKVSRVINCTGPQVNYYELKDGLVLNMVKKGLILPDELKMGIQASPDGQVIGRGKQFTPGMYAIGSLLRGVLWETTAVPEIRLQAESIAKQIIASL